MAGANRRYETYCDFAIFFASSALAPIPGALFPTFPSGALGTTTVAAWLGLWRGWTGVALGESLGVLMVAMMVILSGKQAAVDHSGAKMVQGKKFESNIEPCNFYAPSLIDRFT